MLKVLKEEKIELDQELLDSVSGGNDQLGPTGCEKECGDYLSCL